MPSPLDFLSLVYTQWFIKPTYPRYPCEGKTIIVTGANVGLGYEASKHFVRLGAAKVILAVRSLKNGEEAKASIERDEKRVGSGVLEVWELDLGRYDSVKAFAKRVDSLERIDAIVENAGIVSSTYRRVEDNESLITVNVVSTLLLALLVLPALKRSASRYNITPTLTIVSSEVHAFTTFPERNQPAIFDYLNDKNTADMSDRYHVSKLLEILAVRQLCQHELKQPYPVTLNCMNPGLCHSSLARNVEGWGFTIMKAILARTTEVGGRTLVHAACAGKESHGEYMSDGVVKQPSVFVRSEEGRKAGERVWAELSAKLERIQPGIMGNL